MLGRGQTCWTCQLPCSLISPSSTPQASIFLRWHTSSIKVFCAAWLSMICALLCCSILTSAAATCLSCLGLMPGLAALLDQEIDQRECRQRISPPPAKEAIEQHTGQKRQGHIGAGDTTGGISLQGGAANLTGNP